METQVTKRLFTVDEYHRMGETGILRPDDRVELIDGEIIQMSPIGHRHTVCVNRATTRFIQAFGIKAVVGPGNPVILNDWTEPEPDVIVLKADPDFYAKQRETLHDVLLVVEVSDSSLPFDQKIKVPRYAAAGIPEVWIEDLQHDLLYLYRDPSGQAFNTVLTFHPCDSVSPLAFPDVEFRVDEFLSTDCEVE